MSDDFISIKHKSYSRTAINQTQRHILFFLFYYYYKSFKTVGSICVGCVHLPHGRMTVRVNANNVSEWLRDFLPCSAVSQNNSPRLKLRRWESERKWETKCRPTLCSATLVGLVYEIIKIKHPGHTLFTVKASCCVQRLIINSSPIWVFLDLVFEQHPK